VCHRRRAMRGRRRRRCRGAPLRSHAGRRMLRARHGCRSGVMRGPAGRRYWSSLRRSGRSPSRRSSTRAALWCAPACPHEHCAALKPCSAARPAALPSCVSDGEDRRGRHTRLALALEAMSLPRRRRGAHLGTRAAGAGPPARPERACARPQRRPRPRWLPRPSRR